VTIISSLLFSESEFGHVSNCKVNHKEKENHKESYEPVTYDGQDSAVLLHHINPVIPT
jgi:hypothetical protein